MSRFQQTLTLVIVATLSLATLSVVDSFAQAAKKPAVIAVVDVEVVFKNLKEREAVEADITQQTEAVQKEANDRASKIKELEADLNVLAKDSKSWEETRAKLEKSAIEFQAWQNYKKAYLEREKVIRIQDLYRKAIDVIGRVAQKDGYDLVLFKDATETPATQNQQQIAALIQNRKVLFSAANLDITDPITQMLNNEFANRGK